jgi:hypothetical protein
MFLLANVSFNLFGITTTLKMTFERQRRRAGGQAASLAGRDSQAGEMTRHGGQAGGMARRGG